MKSTILAALAAAAVLPVAAQTDSTPRVDTRQANQEARIQQGAQSGALTPKETGRLDKAQNKQSRKIAKKKPNPRKVS
jgi:hypothetical protein